MRKRRLSDTTNEIIQIIYIFRTVIVRLSKIPYIHAKVLKENYTAAS